MKISLLSDAHLEFGVDVNALADMLEPADALVLAGDMVTVGCIHLLQEFIEALKGKFVDVVFILGNHEYYGCWDMEAAESRYKEELEGYCHVLIDEYIDIGGVRVVGTTLWTDFDKGRTLSLAPSFMSDYQVIRDGGRPVSSMEIYNRHKYSLESLKRHVEPSMKNVAVVHHSPSLLSNTGRFPISDVTSFFHSEVDLTGYDLVLHGHTHDSVDYIHPNGYRIVSNQLGYPHENDTGWVANKIIEI